MKLLDLFKSERLFLIFYTLFFYVLFSFFVIHFLSLVEILLTSYLINSGLEIFPSMIRFYLIVVLLLLLGILIFILIIYKDRMSLSFLIKLHKKYNWPEENPQLLYDLQIKNYYPKEISLETSQILHKNNKSIYYFLKVNFWKNLIKLFRVHSLYPLIFLFMAHVVLGSILFYSEVSPWSVLKNNKSTLAHHSTYELKPNSGSFFLGQEIIIELKILDPSYQFVSFALAEQAQALKKNQNFNN